MCSRTAYFTSGRDVSPAPPYPAQTSRPNQHSGETVYNLFLIPLNLSHARWNVSLTHILTRSPPNTSALPLLSAATELPGRIVCTTDQSRYLFFKDTLEYTRVAKRAQLKSNILSNKHKQVVMLIYTMRHSAARTIFADRSSGMQGFDWFPGVSGS